MLMQNGAADDSLSEDLTDINHNIAAYIRLGGLANFQDRLRKSFTKPCNDKCFYNKSSSMITSSQVTSPRPDEDAIVSHSFVNFSYQGTESSLMNVDDDERDGECQFDDVDDNDDNCDIDDHDTRIQIHATDRNNNNMAANIIGNNQMMDSVSARASRMLPLSKPCSAVKVIEKIYQALDDLKHQDIEEYLEYSTKIIQLHLGNELHFNLTLYKLLFNCTEPSHVQKLFDEGLIEPKEAPHIGCLFERNFLFSAIALSLSDEHSYAFDILMSITVLIYKTNTSRCRRHIFTCLNRDFTSFITSDIYDNHKKSIGVKCFLRSLVLTGTISLSGLNQFLSKYEAVDTSMDSDMESDSIEVFSTSDDNSDLNTDEEQPREGLGHGQPVGFRPHQHHHHHRDGHAAGGEGRGNDNRKTVGQYLNIIPNTTHDLISMYPLSLRNQCRIVIKGIMPNHSLSQVRRLKILPQELQEFVSFNDEVDRVVKLTPKLRTMPSLSS